RAWATVTVACAPAVWMSLSPAAVRQRASAVRRSGSRLPTAVSRSVCAIRCVCHNRSRKHSGEMTRTLVVWCPDWPVTAAGCSADEPVAVQFANRVVACSAAARVGGVRRGLRRRQAEARCPGLQLVAHDPDGEARAFEPVVASVEAFCPRVEIVRPGVCAVATRGPSRYFGGDEVLAAKMAEAVAHVGGRTGIADGPFAAELAAHKSIVVPPGETAAFLDPLPVDVLDLPDLTDLLHRLGIRTLGGLAALPAASVHERFGGEGLRAHRLASGADERPLVGRVPPPDLTV